MTELVVDDTQINWKQLLFSFKGRINRATFWICLPVSWIVTPKEKYDERTKRSSNERYTYQK